MEEKKNCPFCSGNGYLTTYEYEPPVEYICIHCNGSGEVESDYI